MTLIRLLATIGILALTGDTEVAEIPSFQVVVNVANPVDSLPQDKVSHLFLKKVTRWENSRSVVPVDQSTRSVVREGFTRQVHKKSVGSIRKYWQRMVFSGRLRPPVEFKSDGEVLEFVRKNADAIGYVSDEAVLDGGIKVVEVVP